MKKWIISLSALLVVTLICVSLLPMNAQAATSGICGENVTWEYDRANNRLTISGNGRMYNYTETKKAPWVEADNITDYYSVVIEEGVQSIGDYAFALNKTVGSWLTVPSTVEYIGNKAFTGLESANFYYMGSAPDIAYDAFEGVESINHYTVNWPKVNKRDYGAEKASWREAEIKLIRENSLQLLHLNESLKKEDIDMLLMYDSYRSISYRPREFQVSAYDSTTYGQKDVRLTIDGHNFDYTIFVTNGRNHLDLVDVTFGAIPEYADKEQAIKMEVRLGSLLLEEKKDYTLIYNKTILGADGKVTVKGQGVLEGFEKTFYFPVVKRDISDGFFSMSMRDFTGLPVENESASLMDLYRENYDYYFYGKNEKDYVLCYNNNINMGDADITAVGIDNCYGFVSDTFPIIKHTENERLKSNFIGMLDGPLSNDFYYREMVACPAFFSAFVNDAGGNEVAYILYQVDGETLIPIGQYVGTGSVAYDFTYVYEESAGQGGQVFLLAYSWANEKNEVYAGALLIMVPAKVGPATSMTISRVENDGDFRQDYLYLTGNDGVLENITWSISDTAVATVQNGVVTFKKPGTVTVTGSCGSMKKTYSLSAEGLDLTEGFIFNYKNGKANVIWDNRILEENVDYTLSVEQRDVGTVVTATGKGLFAGQLEKVFNGIDSLADPHTHGYDNSSSTHCKGCGCSRNYQKGIPGDITADGEVNNEDVALLLWHTLFPEDYPLTANGDLTGDGETNNEDVALLLWHTLFPEDYPL